MPTTTKPRAQTREAATTQEEANPLYQARLAAARELRPAPLDNHPARRVNRHGVFREVDLFLRLTEADSPGTRVGIRVIEDVHGWYFATEWVLQEGQYRGASAPLSIHGDPYKTRKQALEAAKTALTETLQKNSQNDHRSPEKAKREARELIDWIQKAVERPDFFDRMTPGRRFPRPLQDDESEQHSEEEPIEQESPATKSSDEKGSGGESGEEDLQKSLF